MESEDERVFAALKNIRLRDSVFQLFSYYQRLFFQSLHCIYFIVIFFSDQEDFSKSTGAKFLYYFKRVKLNSRPTHQ